MSICQYSQYEYRDGSAVHSGCQYIQFLHSIFIVIFSEFCACRVFFSELINYITPSQKRGRTPKNAVYCFNVILTLDLTAEVLKYLSSFKAGKSACAFFVSNVLRCVGLT